MKTMKTKKQFRFPAYLKLLLVLPFTAIFLIAFSSCGNNNKSQETLAESSPPPPPPPPVTRSEDKVFKEVDEMPLFKGGDAALLKYIAENTGYPEQAKLKSITGRMIVKLVVEKDCSVTNVEIAQSADPLLDAEAIRIVSTLPQFEKAGIKDGKKVRVVYMIPITFTLK
jgi:periplasmic protein TonB